VTFSNERPLAVKLDRGNAAFNGKAIDPVVASSLIQQANQLLQQVPQ